jgi:hypothetical protein
MRAAVLALVVVVVAAGREPVAVGSAGEARPATKAGRMSTTDLDTLIRAKDWAAVAHCESAGPASVPTAEAHLANRDEVVRLLAVDCIVAAGGPRAPELLVRSLSDANEQVRINAVNGLYRHLPTGQEAALLAVWDKSRTRDGYVRQQIPMILGRLQARQTVPELRARAQVDQRREVADGVTAGLAKLGDPDARLRIGEMLREARGTRTAEVMEFVRYLDEAWVIPLLLPVLHRRDVAVDLSTHRNVLLRRECDLAVDEVLRISKARFSFPLNPMGQYKDEQIAEVIRHVEALPR